MFKSIFAAGLVAFLLWPAWLIPQESPAGMALITINWHTSFQTMSGWEATAEAGATVSPAFSKYKEQLFNEAVNNLGINRVRVEIKSGSEDSVDYFKQPGSERNLQYRIVNDNNNPYLINPRGFHFTALDFTMDKIVLELKRRLQARGEKLFLNVTYVDFGSSAFEHKNHPQEYAEFVLAVYQHLQSKYGLVPDAWELVLEPDHASWSAKQLSAAVSAAGARLKAKGFVPRFIGPSTANMQRALDYFDEISPASREYFSELSYHRYTGASIPVLEQIKDRAKQNHIDTAMLEHIGAGYNELHQDLSVGRNSSWQQYALAYPELNDRGDKYFEIDDSNPGAPKVILSSRAKFLRQYFLFIRAGAIRFAAISNDDRFNPLAFANPNGKRVVVVKANAAGAFSILGLPAGNYGIKYTTAQQYNVDLRGVSLLAGQRLNASIPDRGVITIYAK